VRHGRLGRHGHRDRPARRGAVRLTAAAVVPALAAGLIAAVGVADAPVASASVASTPWLPFDKPALSTSTKLVFAHYLPTLPVSIDNKAARSDYYTVNYLNPTGEGGVHRAYGGFLRDRPRARAVLATSSWRLLDMQTEVRQAMSAGIDGFALDLVTISPTSQGWKNMTTLLTAAHSVSPTFKIMLQPDMSALSGKTSAAIAAAVAKLAVYPAAYHYGDGRLVVSPFHADSRTVAWWRSWMTTMSSTYKISVAMFPVLNNDQAYGAAFAPISIGIGNWGSRNPQWNPPTATYSTSPIGRIAKIHALGKMWMQPVSVQDSRMREGIYDEAANTLNLRDTWAIALRGKAEWVLLPTWNDYTENSEIAPSANHGFAFLDLMAFYITWFKTGVRPTIVRDGVYLTHRRQPFAAKPSFPQTRLQRWRGGTAPRNTVESLNFLTAPAVVAINVGGVVTRCSVPAGITTCLAPLRAGPVSVSVVRGGSTVTSVTSPAVVDTTPYVQDLQYVAASSLRTGVHPTSSAAAAPRVLAPASVTGVLRAGQVARCSATITGGTPTYTWALGGAVLPRAVRSTLLLPSGSSGKVLACRATVVNAKGRASSLSKSVRIAFLAAPVARTRPALVSPPLAGYSVRVTTGRWSITPTAFRYRFLINGVQAALLSVNHLTLSRAWRGRHLAVEVRAYVRGHAVGRCTTTSSLIR
jgi:hypothetical protein